ncbi:MULTISPECIES: hypothetical protein [unclassified Sphingosinithalassobacter]|uniref:hypothetical protein n=1 Tax=unclassified Sphingosinithalassobacter TaxID=2676235 RepID=UPI00165D89E0|nr:hypothetical protein [Sphingosinithalassobacter sp. CS137]
MHWLFSFGLKAGAAAMAVALIGVAVSGPGVAQSMPSRFAAVGLVADGVILLDQQRGVVYHCSTSTSSRLVQNCLATSRVP